MTVSAVNSGKTFQRDIALATFGPFLCVAAVAVGSPTLQRLALGVIVLTAAPHVASSFAVYFDPDASEILHADRRRYYLAPVGLVVASGVLGFYLGGSHRVALAVLLAFTVWQLHHFSKQNYGVMSLVCRARREARPTELERRLVMAAGVAAMLRIPTFATDVLGGPLTRACSVVGAVGFVAVLLAVVVLRMTGRLDGGMRLGFVCAALFFWAPLFLFTSPLLALGTYAAPHNFQYLVIMWHMRGGRSAVDLRRFTRALVGLAVAGGFTLWAVGQVDFTPGLFGLAAGVATAVTAWHFTLDAGVWKLSQPLQRAYMSRRFAFLR